MRMMSEIIVTAYGFTYKHKTAANVGDLWIGMYNKELISVTRLDSLYITFLHMAPHSKEEVWGATNFYSTFQKYEDK